MKKSLSFAAVAASFLAIFLAVSPSVAQNMAAGQPVTGVSRPAVQAPNGVALLDVAYLFKNLKRMKSQMDQLKTEVESAEASLKRERDNLQSLVDRLKEFKPGTPDFKELEEQIATRDANLRIQTQIQQREFLERESKIYQTVYEEVLQEVDYFAQANNIAIILRFNGDPIDKDKPEDVLRNINKPVVWFSSGLDITGQILHRLDQRAGGTTPMPADNRGLPGGTPRVGGIPMQNVQPRR